MNEEAKKTETKPDPASGAGDETAKLRAEITRLTSALADRQKAEAEARAKAEDLEKAEAAKRGEFERLYGESEARSKATAEQLEAEKAARARFEEHLRGQVDAAVKAAPEALRESWKTALEGLDPIKASQVLEALRSSSPPPATTRPGPAGKGGNSGIRVDPHSSASTQAAVLAGLKAALGSGTE